MYWRMLTLSRWAMFLTVFIFYFAYSWFSFFIAFSMFPLVFWGEGWISSFPIWEVFWSSFGVALLFSFCGAFSFCCISSKDVKKALEELEKEFLDDGITKRVFVRSYKKLLRKYKGLKDDFDESDKKDLRFEREKREEELYYQRYNFVKNLKKTLNV